MNKRQAATLLLVAAASGSAGWVGNELFKSTHISPGESIAGNWVTFVTVLTDGQGNLRAAEDVRIAAQSALDSLSLGLALHYDDLPDETRDMIIPYLARVETSLADKEPEKPKTATNCIAQATQSGYMDPDCIAAAVKRSS